MIRDKSGARAQVHYGREVICYNRQGMQIGAHQTQDPIHLLLLGVVCDIGWCPICHRKRHADRAHQTKTQNTHITSSLYHSLNVTNRFGLVHLVVFNIIEQSFNGCQLIWFDLIRFVRF